MTTKQVAVNQAAVTAQTRVNLKEAIVQDHVTMRNLHDAVWLKEGLRVVCLEGIFYE
jgi:hypothetical protein